MVVRASNFFVHAQGIYLKIVRGGRLIEGQKRRAWFIIIANYCLWLIINPHPHEENGEGLRGRRF